VAKVAGCVCSCRANLVGQLDVRAAVEKHSQHCHAATLCSNGQDRLVVLASARIGRDVGSQRAARQIGEVLECKVVQDGNLVGGRQRFQVGDSV
jgi:hypothetical protein